MASPSTVVTLGFGSFGSVNLLPTLGFGVGAAVAVDGPGLRVDLPFLSYRVDLPGLHYRVDLPENLTRVDLVQP